MTEPFTNHSGHSARQKDRRYSCSGREPTLDPNDRSTPNTPETAYHGLLEVQCNVVIDVIFKSTSKRNWVHICLQEWIDLERSDICLALTQRWILQRWNRNECVCDVFTPLYTQWVLRTSRTTTTEFLAGQTVDSCRPLHAVDNYASPRIHIHRSDCATDMAYTGISSPW